MASERVRLFLPLVERYNERVAVEDLVARARTRPVRCRTRAPAPRTLPAAGQAERRGVLTDLDEHGIACPHTVMQVVTDDMPFLPPLANDRAPPLRVRPAHRDPCRVRGRAQSGRGLLGVLGEEEKVSGEVETVRESFHRIKIDRQADADVLDRPRLD
jgi:glutamate dehydrogenase